ncbi:MAG: hypothetical protein HKK67_09195 [Chlorobiaceae bacterium]|nr:hypothetical protein [Chlorobiaceae bacterium]
MLAAPVSKDRSLLPCFDSIKNGNALALSISQQEALKMLKPVDQFALLAAPARKMCSLISAFDSIRNSFQSAFSATQQEALKLKNLSVSVDQLALFAAPAYKNNLFLPCFDSIKNINALPFSVSKQAAFNITEMFKPVNQLALLGAPVGYHRSVLPSVDSVVDAATLADSGAFKVIRDLQQEMRDHNKSLGMLAAPVGYHRSVLPSVDSVVDAATLADSGAFKVIRDLQQEMRDYNECLGILAAPVGYHRSVLRGVDSVVDAATLAGSGAFKIARDVLQSDPILRFDGFREDVMLRPVFPLEHNRITDVPKTEHPLIIKKNCPEEEYNPNQDEMRVRLLEAVDTYLERQSKKIRQTRERLEFCETEELKQKQEGVIQAHDSLVQWAETIERDYLLLTEEELIQQLQENPEIIGYLLEGLQTIKIRNNQLHNEPEFIEKQRIRVAYNHNSFELDDDTDHLLNYEVVRWLDRVRSEGIAGNHEPERNENNAHETALHKIEATSEIKFHERDISDRHFEKNLDTEKEVYRIACEHKPRETWPDCVFDELFEIRKRTGETNLKVSERFCEIAGIIEQARALKKAWIDHNSSKNKKGTIQAQSRHDSDTIQTRNHI